MKDVDIASEYIKNKIPEKPEIAVILGSGLGEFPSNLSNSIIIPYKEIPEHPISTVEGHAGEWIYGYLYDKPIICANGRLHYYEGFSMTEVVKIVSIAYEIGCNTCCRLFK